MKHNMPLTVDILLTIAKDPDQYLNIESGPQFELSSTSEKWHEVKETACSPAITDKHLTAACNALCSVVRHMSKSNNTEVRAFAFSKQIFEDLFVAVHKAFDCGKNKPALQVLDTSVQLALQNPHIVEATTYVELVATRMTQIVLEGRPPTRLKEACIVLHCLLRKASDIISFPGVIAAALSQSKPVLLHRCRQQGLRITNLINSGTSDLLAFFTAMVFAINSTASRSAATNLFSYLCLPSYGANWSANIIAASGAIAEHIEADGDILDEIARNVFPALLTDPDQFHAFLKQYESSIGKSTSGLLIFLSLLEVGRERNFVSELEMPLLLNSTAYSRPSAFVPNGSIYNVLGRLLSSQWPRIRLRALNLLFSSLSTNTIIPEQSLECLSHNFASIHDETDSHTRGELLSIFKRLLTRLQRSWQSPKGLMEHESFTLVEKSRSQYEDFVTKYFKFLKSELSSYIPYPRRILALHLLDVIVKLRYHHKGLFEISVEIDERFTDLVVLLLHDAYEDVRESTTSLLLQISENEPSKVKSALNDFDMIQRTSLLSAITNRNDHADALGRLLMLNAANSHHLVAKPHVKPAQNPVFHSTLKDLSGFIASIECFSTTSSFPLHGMLLGLGHFLAHISHEPLDWTKEQVDLLIQISESIWLLAKPHLCVDSPETEVEDVEDEGHGHEGPKDLLAYSWRALRDTSLLMQGMLKAFPASRELYCRIGDMAFEQLAQLRHRGAFSTVAQTFALCCQLVRQNREPQIFSLIHEWYAKSLSQIEAQATNLTRRSAGLPAMLIGILDPNENNSFGNAIRDLWIIATRPTGNDAVGNLMQPSLPQVHALNSLKEIVTHSRFRTRTEILLVPMLNLATSCFDSSFWAIRNCGLMLFRACIIRLDSDTAVQRFKPMEEVSNDFNKHSTPFDVARSLLQRHELPGPSNIKESMPQFEFEADPDVTSEFVFAALDLLGRVHVEKGDHQYVREILQRHLGNKIWHVREQAAQVFATQVPEGSEMAFAQELLTLGGTSLTSNDLHGRLMAVRVVVSTHLNACDFESPDSLLSVIKTLSEGMLHLGQSLTVPIVSAAALDIFNDILEVMLKHYGGSNLTCSSFEALAASFIAVETQQFYLHRRAMVLFRTYRAAIVHDSHFSELAGQILADYDIAIHVLERVKSVAFVSKSQFLANLFIELILHTKSNDVYCCAIEAICVFLSERGNAIRVDAIAPLLDGIQSEEPLTRDLLIAKLRLYASLLQFGWPVDDTSMEMFRPYTHWFVSNLATAASESTDTSTRRSAVDAVKTIISIPYFIDVYEQAFDQKEVCGLMFLIYDFLNDDDADIRSEASSIWTILSSFCNPEISHSAGLCAVAARLELRSFILHKFGSLPEFGEFALWRLLGLQGGQLDYVNESTLRGTPIPQPVHVLLSHAVKNATDLFAEEKQNLYIDDIAEIEGWGQVIKSVKIELLDHDLMQALYLWTTNGLRSFVDLLKVEAHNGNHVKDFEQHTSLHSGDIARQNLMFSLTFNPDVMAIFLRLIVLASSLDQLPTIHHNPSLSNLQDLLQNVQDLCQVKTVNKWMAEILSSYIF